MPDSIVTEFPMVPASQRALSNRRPVYGIGINDAPYATKPFIDGKQATCPFFRRWDSMLQRCYYPSHVQRFPSYGKASVCDEWLNFMAFREWMAQEHWQGLQLDKDVRYPDNTVYAPDKCLFVSPLVNSLFTGGNPDKELPTGVKWNKHAQKYRSAVHVDGAQKHLGTFDTPEEASRAYRKAKREIVMKVAAEQADYRVCEGLMRHAALLLD